MRALRPQFRANGTRNHDRNNRSPHEKRQEKTPGATLLGILVACYRQAGLNASGGVRRRMFGFPSRKGGQITAVAGPTMSISGTNPNTRESSLPNRVRLSPITK